MKPRRFASATTFSINWSRGTAKLAHYSPPGEAASRAGRSPHTVGRRNANSIFPTRRARFAGWPTSPLRGEASYFSHQLVAGDGQDRLGLLEDGEDVAGRILEPGDVRASTCRGAAGNAARVGQLPVVLEFDACGGPLINSSVDFVDREVEDFVPRPHMVALGLHEEC